MVTQGNEPKTAVAQRGNGAWRASLSHLTDHVERMAFTATRAAAALVAKAAAPDDRATRGLVASMETHMREAVQSLFPRIRAFERARCGRGPWPEPRATTLRDDLDAALARAHSLREGVEELRARVTSRSPVADGSADEMHRLLGAMDHALCAQLELESLLYARAADLASDGVDRAVRDRASRD